MSTDNLIKLSPELKKELTDKVQAAYHRAEQKSIELREHFELMYWTKVESVWRLFKPNTTRKVYPCATKSFEEFSESVANYPFWLWEVESEMPEAAAWAKAECVRVAIEKRLDFLSGDGEIFMTQKDYLFIMYTY